jgi:hypothetical protein
MQEANEFDQYYEEQDATAEAEQAEREMGERLKVFGVRLRAKAEDQVKRRFSIEERWLDDLRQFNGQYDKVTAATLAASGGSKLYVNITRNKVNAAEARLIDILFPTDDRNWGIQPTPVPYLTKLAKDQDPVSNEDGSPFVTQEGVQVQNRDVAQSVMEEARERSEAMQDEIDDQLNETNYNSVNRDMVHDAVLYGTGIIKGPVILGKTRQKWSEVADDQGRVAQVMEVIDDLKPGAERVDPWDFFPDMQARKIDDAEFVFQRHYMSKKALRELADKPGFLRSQIAEVLKQDVDGSQTATHLQEMQSMAGISSLDNGRFEVWEYHGPVDKDDLIAAGVEVDEDDVFSDYNGVVWFSEGHVLKAVVNPADTGEMPYSVFNWEKDDTTLFGVGIPHLMRSSQKVLNATWRMLMDNAGLSVGPQTVINSHVVRPADGNWRLTPHKIWELTDKNGNVNNVFGSFEINSHMTELISLFQYARQIADEETALPQISQGEQGTATDTASGMSMLMNSANTMLRRVVKNYDDDITRPFIKRMYDWNMQFNPKEELKGDFSVDARGTSSLLVKEQQAANLMALMNISASPLLEPLTNTAALYRKVVSSMQIEADEIVKTTEEIELETQKIEQQMQAQQEMMMQAQQQQGQQAPTGDPLAQQKLELDAQKMQMDGQLKGAQIQAQAQKLQVDQQKMASDRELELAKMAAEKGIKVSEMRTKLGIEKMKVQSKDTLFEKEQALKMRMGSGI